MLASNIAYARGAGRVVQVASSCLAEPGEAAVRVFLRPSLVSGSDWPGVASGVLRTP